MKGSDIAIVLGGGPGKGSGEASSGGGDYEAAIDDMEAGLGVKIKDRRMFRAGLMAFVEECMANSEGEYPDEEPAPASERRESSGEG